MSKDKPRAGILGMGYYVPEKILTNSDLEKMVDTSTEWIQTRTGIQERRIAEPGTPASFLGAEASKKALEDASVEAEDIDLIITATTTQDMLFTLQTVSCFGSCALAPVVVVDDKVHGRLTSDSLRRLVNGLKADGKKKTKKRTKKTRKTKKGQTKRVRTAKSTKKRRVSQRA